MEKSVRVNDETVPAFTVPVAGVQRPCEPDDPRPFFLTGSVAEYFGRPVVSVSRKRSIRVNFELDGIWGWGFGGFS